MSLNFKNKPRRSTSDPAHVQATGKGCLKILAVGTVLTASPFLSLLMPEREAEAKFKLPETELPHAAVQAQKILPVLLWHNNIAPDKYAPFSRNWVVKTGDSINKIARQYEVPADLIMSLNHRFGLEANRIRPGEQLKLPSVRGIKLDQQGWHGQVFSLNLGSKADWVYLCQHLLCSEAASSPVREAISCATQYMPSDLRRPFIRQVSATMREIASGEISIASKQDSALPRITRVHWPQRDFSKVCQLSQLAAAYGWALEASIQQKSDTPRKGEDAIPEIIPHPFRLSPSALIANIESLRTINFIKTEAFSPLNFPMPHSYISISDLTGYPALRLDDMKTGGQPYVQITCGTGDYNGAFSSAQIIFSASKTTDVPVLYFESFDGPDMISQCQDISNRIGEKPFSLVLGGHGDHNEAGCSLQVGYTSWAQRSAGTSYYLSSQRDAAAISTLAKETIFILSCNSGAPTPKGLNFVDAIAEAAGTRQLSEPLYIFGLNKPSNVCDAQITSEGSVIPVIGKDNENSYMRKVRASRKKAEKK